MTKNKKSKGIYLLSSKNLNKALTGVPRAPVARFSPDIDTIRGAMSI